MKKKPLDPIAVIQSRVEGATLGEIADKYHVSRQAIYKIYADLPKRPVSKNSENYYAAIDSVRALSSYTIAQVCVSYLSGKKLPYIERQYNLIEEEVYECFYLVSDRLSNYRNGDAKTYFPAILAWKKHYNISYTQRADELGISHDILEKYVKAWMHIPYDVICSIKQASGLSTTDIVKHLFAIDNKYLSSAIFTSPGNIHKRN